MQDKQLLQGMAFTEGLRMLQCRFITQRNGHRKTLLSRGMYAIDSIAMLYLILILKMILVSVDS
jgi:hypothetical protein